jgi:3-deoxy-manno-octulosonate cytidylyltransferase (CMP-KDO synthetase)
MRVLIVIPARFGSTRFPGKPLAPILGVPMIRRVHAIARAGAPDARVVVATDDERITDFVRGFGGEAVMTPDTIRNGTERAAVVDKQLGSDFGFVINLQGDAVLTPPWVISAVVEAAADPAVEMATPAVRMSAQSFERLRNAKAGGEVGGTTVTFDCKHDALYFSKSIIPFVRTVTDPLPVWRHIGLYGYRSATLARLVALSPGPLEMAEQLEQLRALEHGIRIRIVPVDYRGRTHWGVDSPEDLRRCEEFILREGELVPGLGDAV